MIKDYIVVKGDNYDTALSEGLEKLDLTEDQVKIEVIEEKKGFLFKKGFVKLKIKQLDLNGHDKKHGEDFKLNLNSQNINEKPFYIDYRFDGVYLTVLKDFKIDDLLNFISKKQIKKYDLDAINNCIQKKDETSYKIAPHQEEFLIDSYLKINTSKNKLETIITLVEPSGGKVMTPVEIVNNLNENGVKFGINNAAIEEIVNNEIFNKPIIVATGKEAVAGKDGEIIYIFNDKKNKKATISEDGKIDYKNLDKIRNVKKGDLLVEIIPPSEGINGIDVYGNEIVAKKGKEVFIKKGKNIKTSEDGLKIYADKDGEVNLIDGKLYVNEVITIDGNVDNETGNIKFNGKVSVKGNVKSGFKIEAEGNIEIFGVVEGSTLISRGSIIIHRGVQGNSQSNIQCIEDLVVKYLENAKVKCYGSIKADAILHSDVTARGKIEVCGRKSLIVGGNIKAGQKINVGTIGSNMGTVTEIQVGIDPEEKFYHEELKLEIQNIEKKMDSSKKAIELLDKLSKKQKLDKEKQKLLDKSLNTYKVLKVKHSKLSEKLQELSEKFKDQNSGRIYASKIIYPGVNIVIGNHSKRIYDDMSSCLLYIKDGEIVNGTYRK